MIAVRTDYDCSSLQLDRGQQRMSRSSKWQKKLQQKKGGGTSTPKRPYQKVSALNYSKVELSTYTCLQPVALITS